MSQDRISIIEQCAADSIAGTIAFPVVVGKLLQAGVERYHVDYSRSEATYYFADGQSHVVKVNHGHTPIAQTFNAKEVENAIRDSQAGRIKYADFLRRTSEAGCVGYFAQLAGRRVLYFGRNGDLHLEPFPTAPSKD